MPTPPYASLAEFIEALDELVPDMKGGYDEAAFIDKALRRLADDHPAVESVDIGAGFFDAEFFDAEFFSTESREFLLPGVVFSRWVDGFSERQTVDAEALDEDGQPFEDEEDWPGGLRVESRSRSGVLGRYLVFREVPTATSPARVRFRRPYVVTEDLVEVPTHMQGAVLDWAAALKCDALSAFYRSSIDPAGGADIFDARQYARDYADQAKQFRERYAELGGVGDDEPSFSHGQIKTQDPSVYGSSRGYYSGRRDQDE